MNSKLYQIFVSDPYVRVAQLILMSGGELGLDIYTHAKTNLRGLPMIRDQIRTRHQVESFDKLPTNKGQSGREVV